MYVVSRSSLPMKLRRMRNEEYPSEYSHAFTNMEISHPTPQNQARILNSEGLAEHVAGEVTCD